MSAQPQPEEGSSIEASFNQVSHGIAEKLTNRLANVHATFVDGKLTVTPTYRIVNYHLGATKVGESGMGSRDNEVEVGRANVTKTAELLRQQLRSDDETLRLNDPPVGDIFFGTALSPVTTVIEANDTAADLVKKSDEATPYGRAAVPRFSEKGIPAPVARAIVWATARATAQTIDEETGRAASEIDDRYVQSAQTRLAKAIADSEAQLVDSRDELRVTEATQTRLDARASETQAKSTDLKEKASRLQRLPALVGERVPRDVFEQTIKDLDYPLLAVERQGLVIKKEVATGVRADPIDGSLARLVDSSGPTSDETNNALQAFGYRGGSLGTIDMLNDTIGAAAASQAREQFATPAEQARQLFYEAKTILQAFPSQGLATKLSAQEKAFDEMVKKDPQGAVTVASQLFARAHNLNLLTTPTRKSRFPENPGWPITTRLLRSYQSEVGRKLMGKRVYQDAKTDEEQAKAAQSEGGAHLAEKRGTVRTQETNLNGQQTEKDNLTAQKTQRISALKAEMAAKLLTDQFGNPIDEKALAANPWRLSEFVTKSKLFSDTVAAVSFGMPRCMAGEPGSETRQAILGDMQYHAAIREKDESLTRSEDFLGSLIDPLVPENHPTRALALRLTGEMLRRYSLDKRVLMMGGYPAGKEINEDNMRYRWDSLRPMLTAILRGGRVLDVSGQTPHLKLSAIDRSQATYESVKRQFNSTGQTHDAYTTLTRIIAQAIPDGNGFIVPENALLRFQEPEFQHDRVPIPLRDILDQGRGVDMYEIVSRKLQLFDVLPFNRPLYLIENK
ncbi:hypothetical protein M1523_01700 [Patescibacteria group bacterium]|nr:hypothetical protein [Patescibacteria group bacterium]